MKRFFLSFALLCLFSTAFAYEKEDVNSRWVAFKDPSTKHVAGVPLRDTWWSRPHEYAWAQKFAGKDLVVFDAACGISHPLKWYLAENCRQVWACDIDKRISCTPLIMQETLNDLGKEAYDVVKAKGRLVDSVHTICSSMCALPKYLPKFDRIFCISTLEEMPVVDREKALSEFTKVLKPDGLVVITFDYPYVTPEALLETAAKVGLVPAGEVTLGPPPPGTLSNPEFAIYRCVLKML